MKKAKVEKGIWEENSQRSKEKSIDIIYHQIDRQECRVRHTGLDSELWILPLTWFPPSGKSYQAPVSGFIGQMISVMIQLEILSRTRPTTQ